MSLWSIGSAADPCYWRRVARRAVLGVSGVMVFAVIFLYGASEWRLRETYDVVLKPLRAMAPTALIAEGERLSRVFGCRGCHREAGNVLFEQTAVVRLVAPNLSRVIREYSDEELVRLVRRGVKRNGTSIIAMPARSFEHMSDNDLALVIAALRAEPELPDKVEGGTSWGPLGRIAIVAGKVPFSADGLGPDLAPLHRPDGGAEEEGGYLVSTLCSDCHELFSERDNGWGMVAPPVAMMAQAYPPEDFRHLMRTGEGTGGRDLGPMSEVARMDFSQMTGSEVEAIHAYLNSLDLPEE
ncbi:MAG: c-type cytochrome [Parvibaculum sp.]